MVFPIRASIFFTPLHVCASVPIAGEDVVLEDFVAAVGFGVSWIDAADDVDLRVDTHYTAMMPRLG